LSVAEGPHSGLDQRRKGWRSIEREHAKNVKLAQQLYALEPTHRRRALLVQALSNWETARAHRMALDTLRVPRRVGGYVLD
jgi:hypothetical protein